MFLNVSVHKLYFLLHSEYLCNPKIYIKILTSYVIVVGGGPLGWLDHEGRALMNDINALSRKLSVMWGHSEKTAICEPRSGVLNDSARTLILLSNPQELWEMFVG